MFDCNVILVNTIVVSIEQSTSTEIKQLPIEYGSGILVKYLDDKIIICAKNTTKLQQGSFTLEADVIKIESGKGVVISSKGKDTLVISADLIKLDEMIFDLKKDTDARLKNIEQAFAQILRTIKK